MQGDERAQPRAPPPAATPAAPRPAAAPPSAPRPAGRRARRICVASQKHRLTPRTSSITPAASLLPTSLEDKYGRAAVHLAAIHGNAQLLCLLLDDPRTVVPADLLEVAIREVSL